MNDIKCADCGHVADTVDFRTGCKQCGHSCFVVYLGFGAEAQVTATNATPPPLFACPRCASLERHAVDLQAEIAQLRAQLDQSEARHKRLVRGLKGLLVRGVE